ncbi:hypothetical protein V9W41_35190 [Pseudomonas aeruginosa]
MTLNKSFFFSFCYITKEFIRSGVFSVDVVIHSDTIPGKPFDDFKTGMAAKVFVLSL